MIRVLFHNIKSKLFILNYKNVSKFFIYLLPFGEILPNLPTSLLFFIEIRYVTFYQLDGKYNLKFATNAVMI